VALLVLALLLPLWWTVPAAHSLPPDVIDGGSIDTGSLDPGDIGPGDVEPGTVDPGTTDPGRDTGPVDPGSIGTGPDDPAIFIPPPTTTPPPPPTTLPPPPPTTLPPITPPTIPPVLDPGGGPGPECTGGMTRPTGKIAPGYIYTPTLFDGTTPDPQPDDTFVADGPGHATRTGRLTTRVNNGREEFLVCAHVGTNTPDPALTAFATSGPGAHPATLTAAVVVIDATGGTTTYPVGDPQLGASFVIPYTGATTPAEGFLGAWVPFTPSLHEPGFTVRVEVRGTAATPGGGTALAMGADEVFVHLGQSPQADFQPVAEAVGVALDDAVIGERSTDPGPDDLSTLMGFQLRNMLSAKVSALAPYHISGDWDWDPGLATLASGAAGDVDQANFLPSAATIDLAPIDADESRLNVHLAGTVNMHMTVEPRSFGTFSYFAGSCGVRASVSISLDLAVTVGLTPDRARPVINLSLADSSIDTTSLDSQGVLWALFLGIPHPEPCSVLDGKFEGGVEKQIKEKFDEINAGPTRDELLKQIESKLKPADLANGPISKANVTIPGGVSFGLSNARWRQTAPSGQGHQGGAVWLHPEGADLAADLAVIDTGGTRFPFSYVPTATSSVLAQTHARTRLLRVKKPRVLDPGIDIPTVPITTTKIPFTSKAFIVRPPIGDLPTFELVDRVADFDLGMVVNGATVNQLLRALTAGGPVGIVADPGPVIAERLKTIDRVIGPGVLDQTTDVGILDIITKVDASGDGTPDTDINIHPSVAPMYLPTAPAGWPTPGDVNLYVPSLRISIPVPQVATMATDIRMGASATIDTATNHLVPSVGQVSVTSRFLRLGPSINTLLDPSNDVIVGIATSKIREAVPPKLAEALAPIALPDLKSMFGTPGFTPVVMSNLSVRTVGGGHLGIHLDVNPNPAKVAVGVAFNGGSDTTPPTSFTVHASPTQFPGTGDYTVSWRILDAATNSVVYQSPAGGEVGLDKTLPVTGVTTTVADPCFGERSMGVRVFVTVTRANVTASGQGDGSGGWTGQPTKPPHLCGPDTDPEPLPTTPPHL
jgi:hypothetical protein